MVTDVNYSHCGDHFTIMLYTWNEHSAIGQLYLNKKKREKKPAAVQAWDLRMK